MLSSVNCSYYDLAMEEQGPTGGGGGGQVFKEAEKNIRTLVIRREARDSQNSLNGTNKNSSCGQCTFPTENSFVLSLTVTKEKQYHYYLLYRLSKFVYYRYNWFLFYRLLNNYWKWSYMIHAVISSLENSVVSSQGSNQCVFVFCPITLPSAV